MPHRLPQKTTDVQPAMSEAPGAGAGPGPGPQRADEMQDSLKRGAFPLDEHVVPPAKWTFNKKGMPQAIAHRGYKAEFPENTMGAFRGAVDIGAHAIETDVHLSKDDVVVIAHVSVDSSSRKVLVCSLYVA